MTGFIRIHIILSARQLVLHQHYIDVGLVDRSCLETTLPLLDPPVVTARLTSHPFRSDYARVVLSISPDSFTKERGFNNIRILTCFFVRLLCCRNSYVACYAPISTTQKTDKNPASNFRILLNPHS